MGMNEYGICYNDNRGRLNTEFIIMTSGDACPTTNKGSAIPFSKGQNLLDKRYV